LIEVGLGYPHVKGDGCDVKGADGFAIASAACRLKKCRRVGFPRKKTIFT